MSYVAFLSNNFATSLALADVCARSTECHSNCKGVNTFHVCKQ